MIAYSTAALDKRILRNVVDQAHANRLLSDDDVKQIHAAYPDDLYTPHIFVRFGFGLLTLIASGAVFGLLLLMTGGAAPAFICLLMAGITLFALQYFVKEKRHYESGVDGVLLHLTLIFVVSAAVVATDFDSSFAQVVACLFAIPLLAAAAIFFLNRIAAALLPPAVWLLVHSFFTEYEKPLLFFVLAAVVMGALAWLFYRLAQKNKWPYHHSVLNWALLSSVICCYASLHVHTIIAIGTAYPWKTTIAIGTAYPWKTTIWGSWIILFWSWTVIIPFLLLYYGIKTASNAWIRLGIFGILSIFYFYHIYFPLIEPELAAMLGGIVLVCLAAYFIIRLRRNPAGRLVFRPELETDELMIPASLVGMIRLPATTTDTGTSYRGGSFGGGGAGGDF